MEARTTIAVCYKVGTSDILRVWFDSILRHTGVCRVVVVTSDEKSAYEASDVRKDLGYTPVCMDVTCVCPDKVPLSRVHGAMLDAFLKSYKLKTELLLSMDSDCFPIADGWLDGLERMIDEGAKVAGILHPWAPPPADMGHDKIEWRVRSQHCWERTHVACQMISLVDLKELGVTFAGGDDTGLMIPDAALKKGWKVDGYKVTRCAKPKDGSDPEFNRFVSLVFGDKVYHHGGFTRVTVGGDKPVMEAAYGWVLPELLAHKGAEFLLQCDNSYCFKFDREEEVAADKMDRLFGSKTMLQRTSRSTRNSFGTSFVWKLLPT